MRALQWADAALPYETCAVERCCPLPVRTCRIPGMGIPNSCFDALGGFVPPERIALGIPGSERGLAPLMDGVTCFSRLAARRPGLGRIY